MYRCVQIKLLFWINNFWACKLLKFLQFSHCISHFPLYTTPAAWLGSSGIFGKSETFRLPLHLLRPCCSCCYCCCFGMLSLARVFFFCLHCCVCVSVWVQKHFFVAANDDAHNLHFEFWGVKSNMQNIVCLNSDTSTDFDSLGVRSSWVQWSHSSELFFAWNLATN